MSNGRYRERRAKPKEIIERLNMEAVRCRVQKDVFWARLDSMIQLTPALERSERVRHICTELPRWLVSVSLKEGDLDQYDRDVMKGIFLEVPRTLSLVLLQIGSLGAKLLWSDPVNAQINADQMFEKCMEMLREMPAYARCTDRQIKELERELRFMIRRYTDEKGECREIVRTFFRAHHTEYLTVVETLDQRLSAVIEKLEVRERAEFPATEEKQIPEVTAAVEQPVVQKTQTAEEPVTAVEAPVLIEDADTEQAGMFHSGEFQQIMERLNYMEKSLARISRDVDMFDDDGPGLCRFVDRTASFVYHKSLSRLYDLYVNMPEQIPVKELETILRSFFHALRTLDIEPIDARRLEADFPVEYREELEGRGKKTYCYSLCGWSYKDSMVISPLFEEVKKNEHE